ncbi:unnamed protein product [Lactuca virosa]|uniref:Uncharacterized protein n=1 Tax=Lactuca virosa TaxID=75947 RepID=A0AAU9MTU5_9ASTR|nr:unnamed protein product [Lactuca virosa]
MLKVLLSYDVCVHEGWPGNFVCYESSNRGVVLETSERLVVGYGGCNVKKGSHFLHFGHVESPLVGDSGVGGANGINWLERFLAVDGDLACLVKENHALRSENVLLQKKVFEIVGNV